MGKTRFMNRKQYIAMEDPSALADSLQFIEDALTELDVKRPLLLRTRMLAEEIVPRLIESGAPDGKLTVQVRRFLGDAVVHIRAPGGECDLLESPDYSAQSIGEMEDDDVQRAVRSILLKSQGNSFKFAHRNGVNQVRILTGHAEQQTLAAVAAALLLGLVCGLLLHTVVPAGAADALAHYLLDPLKTMFMNALQVVVCPVIFFSIVTCIAQFKDLSELGRIGAKVMGMYFLTTVFAVLLGIGSALLFHPGEWGFALSADVLTPAVSVDTGVDTSVFNMLINIVPSNIVRPFLEADTLQVIFLAILCGIAVGAIGEYSVILQNLFEACNSLFLTMTSMIARFIPVAVFSSVSLMVLDMGRDSLLAVLGLAGSTIATIVCMMMVYGLLTAVLGRLNPLTFFRKAREGMLTSFTLSSSAAAMPANMKVCTEKLGISPKVCSFSIPLGATINMDGSSITFICFALFLARAYGVAVDASALVSLAVTVILISMGCPGIPGSGLVCLAVILNSLGIPVEAIGLIMGISPFIDMFCTMSNTTGDVMTSLVVAKSEGLLDIDTYNA